MDCEGESVPCSDPAAIWWLPLAYLNFNLICQVCWNLHVVTLHIPLNIHYELVKSLAIHRGFIVIAEAMYRINVFESSDWRSAWFFQFHLALRVKM